MRLLQRKLPLQMFLEGIFDLVELIFDFSTARPLSTNNCQFTNRIVINKAVLQIIATLLCYLSNPLRADHYECKHSSDQLAC